MRAFLKDAGMIVGVAMLIPFAPIVGAVVAAGVTIWFIFSAFSELAAWAFGRKKPPTKEWWQK